MNPLLVAVTTAGLLLALSSVSLACLPTQGGPSALLNTAVLLTERLNVLSSQNETVEEKPTGSPSDLNYKSFSFPSNCPPSCIRTFLKYHNYWGSMLRNRTFVLDWNYQTNMTRANQRKVGLQHRVSNKWSAKVQRFAAKLSTDGLTEFEMRQIGILKNESAPMKKKEFRPYMRSKRQMAFIYARATVVRKNKQRLIGQSDVKKFFRKNRNYDALAEVWTLWRQEAGRPLRPYFEEMVAIETTIAKRHNFTDYGRKLWLKDFGDPRFNEKVMDMFAEVMPLYKELHAYVRFKLSSAYPNRFDPNGPIPAHILGNPWAQTWQNIFDIVKPYPNALSTDVTAEMQRQNWTVLRMFKTAEEFFVSLGLPKMVPKFWKLSMMKKPKDRRVICHGSAWDFSTGDDFRIKMCTDVTQNHLQTIHHEMGHTIYHMLYAHLPLVYRGAANTAFHEAVGDTLGLSVNTIQHLAKLGLVKSNTLTKEVEINKLMRVALYNVAVLPFALAMETWRWRIYNGTIKKSEYNRGWWELRRDLQGLKPPVARTEKDFDPGAKFHIANNVPCIRYFISDFMQFQFYEAMCRASGHQGPLYTCDFYRSKAAGDLLRSTLSLGLSKPWPEAMRAMTGQPQVSTGALRRYFAPLFVWLKAFRKTHEYPIGW